LTNNTTYQIGLRSLVTRSYCLRARISGCDGQVHDADPNRGGGEHRFDCLGEPLQPVHARDQDVLDALLLEAGEDLHQNLAPSLA
jgi:hypothetical protein